MAKNNFLKLSVSVLILQLSGGIGAAFSFISLSDWYPTLNRPVFTPPDWIFAPVWTILYLLMGTSLYLVWKEGLGKPEVKRAVKFFGVQLILNILWSAFFFGLRSPFLALIDIFGLNILIYLTIKEFRKINSLASYLLWPYWGWVLFATLLNFSLWILN